ncbi:WXG100 family type VII secretion target [Mycobacterium celatum]|uniref:WXG100 family type VII secretion target n=2 Tax=Mycobacterium celatum TaxID=28045 RepID=A0A1X1RH38_MYCCE|nr:WXG100 family type VII secretion target [Mycobacterium celatum]ORV05680.1 hypothetical protein AWB95_22550 [Mycobacterium celatum]PIB73377.1 WXG100 family type VII secretion target [Mycobacterium celatum]
MSELRVTPEQLTHASAEFGAVAQELRAGLGSIDDEVGKLLGGSWTGEASSSYDAVWREWHEGATKVLHEVPQVLFLFGCEGRGWLARGV